jgi:PhnB protein
MRTGTTLVFDGRGEAEQVIKTLSENGKLQMPLNDTFWAKRFGMVVDQFGSPWRVNCGNPK